eukprot:jgi/Mesen1/5482/ME000276S04609
MWWSASFLACLIVAIVVLVLILGIALGHLVAVRNPHWVKRLERLQSLFVTEGGVKISVRQAFRNVKAYSRRYIQVGPRYEWNKNLRYGPFWTPGKGEQPGCPICLGKLGGSKREVSVNPCRHEFDKTCIDGFFALYPVCPLCHVNAFTRTAPNGPDAAASDKAAAAAAAGADVEAGAGGQAAGLQKAGGLKQPKDDGYYHPFVYAYDCAAKAVKECLQQARLYLWASPAANKSAALKIGDAQQ